MSGRLEGGREKNTSKYGEGWGEEEREGRDEGEGGEQGEENTNCEHVLTIRGRDGGEDGVMRDRGRGERNMAEERDGREIWRGKERNKRREGG